MNANGTLIKELADKYGRERTSLLPIFQGITDKNNYLTEEDLTQIAAELHLSGAQVFGTASFYSFLNMVPRGKYVIRVCKTISCDMKNRREITEQIEDMLKISTGETTEDKKFTLLYTNCMGWCDKAPSMLINETPYTNLTPAKVQTILKEYIEKE
ncbi:MAG: NAD(P)H-dependent oxidoreductase subunit E [Ignavibacteria bacterium]|nr:NAD(P)H-dependent oxidoreductase subunit E [Ignavibacteria bacterium]